MGDTQQKKHKVLLVDDEVDFIQPLAFWLQFKGYEVVVAFDGKNALQKLKEEKPDIIFMDLNMPGMSGVEAVGMIRGLDPEVPVIIISAYIDEERIKEVLSCGISGVFYKGADFQEGLTLLETTLRTHKKLKKTT